MPLLEISKLTKRFGAIEAVTEVDLTAEPGEIIGLMGDNGAGKSTLVKLVAGNFAPTSGQLSIEGRPVHFTRPVEARDAGIEIVYQDLALCNNLTASANVFLGRERKRRVGPLQLLHDRAMHSRAGELFVQLKSETRPRDEVSKMSGGQRQAIAIARTRLSDARILLLDEPTAAISVRQVAEVLNLIRRLRDQGIAIILISHRMPDVFAAADRIVVLRRGRKVADKSISQSSPEEVTGLITERSMSRDNAVSVEATQAATGRHAAAIEPILDIQEKTLLHRLLANQAVWVTVVIVIICIAITIREPHFGSVENFYNISRNFSFIGITALGMTVVIMAGGIDLSIGSVMGLVAICAGLVLQADYPWYAAIAVGFLAGGLAGATNGALIAYVGLPPFVVTLGMLSAARSLAVILSGQRVVSDFGADGPAFKIFGAGAILGIANPVWFLVVMTIVLAVVLRMTAWGRHVKAIGGNESAATLTGIPVKRIKMQTYIVCALSGSLAAMLTIGWTGSAVNSLGSGYELRAIASTVIGGANLLGGDGSAFGALAGAVLIEIIRNALLMAGVDSNWQGLFVGAIIVLAVLLERIRRHRRE